MQPAHHTRENCTNAVTRNPPAHLHEGFFFPPGEQERAPLREREGAGEGGTRDREAGRQRGLKEHSGVFRKVVQRKETCVRTDLIEVFNQ